MIKINLLREPTTKHKSDWTPEKSQVGIYAVILMFLAVAAMAWWYWHLLGLRTEHTAEMEQLEQENMRLKIVQAEVDKYDRQKRLLEDRINVIEQLKNNQKGPVEMMNAVIACVPSEPRLWLESIEQRDTQVKIKGESLEVPSISDFINRLNATPPFRQVDLVGYQEEKGKFKFELSCQVGS
jgi:Tfp pilus assembly protein PilN